MFGQYLHMFPKVSPDAIAGVAQGPERPCLHFTYKKVLSSPSTRTDRPVGPHPLTSSMSVFLCPPVQVCCGWVLLSRALGANCIAESVLKVSFGDWHPECRPFPGSTPSLIVTTSAHVMPTSQTVIASPAWMRQGNTCHLLQWAPLQSPQPKAWRTLGVTPDDFCSRPWPG